MRRLTRAEAKAAAERAGATVGGSVTIDTSLVVSGSGAGEKLSKARKLGVRVISEAGFLSRLNSVRDDPDESADE